MPPLVPFHLVPVGVLEICLSFLSPRAITVGDVPNSISPPRNRRDNIRRSVPRWRGKRCVSVTINNDQILIINTPVPYHIAAVPPWNVRPVVCTSSMADLRKVQFWRHDMISRGCRVVVISIRPEERGTG